VTGPSVGASVTGSKNDELQMTFWQHLEELRGRLLKALLAFAVGAGCAWYFREQVLIWLVTPFVNAWVQAIKDSRPTLHFPAPASLFVAYLRLSLISGLIFAMPVIFYQIWAFVAPGLYARERRFAMPFVVSSTLLFLGGGYFGWKFAFPVAFKYLLDFSGSIHDASISIDVQPTVMIGEYLDFVSRMLAAFGAAFELPVLVFFLTIAGIVNHTHLIKFARYFVVLAFFISAVITPPDIMSQFLLAMPLILLYVLSIGIAWLIGRKKALPDEPPSR
jgi:sec-independent protein translocase protein TatC